MGRRTSEPPENTVGWIESIAKGRQFNWCQIIGLIQITSRLRWKSNLFLLLWLGDEPPFFAQLFWACSMLGHGSGNSFTYTDLPAQCARDQRRPDYHGYDDHGDDRGFLEFGAGGEVEHQ